MHEYLDDAEFDAHLFDPEDDRHFNPGEPRTEAGRSDVTVRPRAVLAGCTDLRQLALARLMQAHEARLARPVAIEAARPHLTSNASASPPPAPSQALADQAAAWEPHGHDEDFDLWDELARPTHRKSLRSMV